VKLISFQSMMNKMRENIFPFRLQFNANEGILNKIKCLKFAYLFSSKVNETINIKNLVLNEMLRCVSKYKK
jgi:hypothetical protein